MSNAMGKPMGHVRRAALALVLGSLLWLVTAACSSTSHRHPPGAAEPAVAPAGGPAAAGSVYPVGDSPEGIVYDRTTRLIAVAVHDPSRLLLLNATTMTLVRSVPLPGTVRHLQLAGPGGPALVPVESAQQLIEVSLPGGQTRSTRVGKQPHDAAAVAGGQYVVGNEFGHSISFVRDGQILKTVSEVRQPGSIVGDGGTVAVVDVGAFTVSTFDVATEKRIAVAPAGSGPTHGVLATGNRLIVADTRGNAVLEYSLSPLRQIGRLSLPGTPYGMAIDQSTDTAWITLTARNQLVGLDVTANTPRIVARYPTVRQPNTVAVEQGSHILWITGTATGQIQRITR